MRIYTKLEYQWDGSAYILISEEGFDYEGLVALACGASGEQKSIFSAQKGFYDELRGSYKTVFGAAQGIFDKLTSTLSPILKAGPSQRGFSGAEHSAREGAITEHTAQDYEHASKALGESQAARGGGNVFVPSGAADQQKQELAQSEAGRESQEQNQLEQEDWATGRQNFMTALGGMESAPNVFNAAQGFANSANSAGGAAAESANQITAANQAWMGPVFGALGGIAGAAIGKIPTGAPAAAPGH